MTIFGRKKQEGNIADDTQDQLADYQRSMIPHLRAIESRLSRAELQIGVLEDEIRRLTFLEKPLEGTKSLGSMLPSIKDLA